MPIEKDSRILSKGVSVLLFGQKTKDDQVITKNSHPALRGSALAGKLLAGLFSLSHWGENVQFHGSLDR